MAKKPSGGYEGDMVGVGHPEGRAKPSARVRPHALLAPKQALGLVGAICSGKSMYLAALHYKLMHGAPEWRVEVDDTAFDSLVYRYLNPFHKGRSLDPTVPGGGFHMSMQVSWHGHKLDLGLWDLAGETYHRYEEAHEHFMPYGWSVADYLARCKAILVTTLCGSALLSWPTSQADVLLSHFFRQFLRRENRLRQVIILAVGVDVYGSVPDDVNKKALRTFERDYPIFPGVLKNAGIKVETVPVSNIGLGNAFGPDRRLISGPPEPYNVLEPLRRIYPLYLPWWRRVLLDLSTKAGTRADAAATKPGHSHIPPAPQKALTGGQMRTDSAPPGKAALVSQPDPTAEYSIAAICQLLESAFTPQTLYRFCLVRPTFEPLIALFGYNLSLSDMVGCVIDYCRTKLLFDELLAEVAEDNPKQYQRLKPYRS